ncbi:hypothetical protein BJ138DRAFT_1141397 [Hygrophoropsis aurantiaca]|uniref:Uncharacterized protein n=1 Tax=Hygrophoropsis aurantiaca TaxID=72124 RepID=A0ACB8ART9_9AGAM|nr:hypothetical protein BJ138DRAFT_1141397 [Hygrophoropsis aurantiaca]
MSIIQIRRKRKRCSYYTDLRVEVESLIPDIAVLNSQVSSPVASISQDPSDFIQGHDRTAHAEARTPKMVTVEEFLRRSPVISRRKYGKRSCVTENMRGNGSLWANGAYIPQIQPQHRSVSSPRSKNCDSRPQKARNTSNAVTNKLFRAAILSHVELDQARGGENSLNARRPLDFVALNKFSSPVATKSKRAQGHSRPRRYKCRTNFEKPPQKDSPSYRPLTTWKTLHSDLYLPESKIVKDAVPISATPNFASNRMPLSFICVQEAELSRRSAHPPNFRTSDSVKASEQQMRPFLLSHRFNSGPVSPKLGKKVKCPPVSTGDLQSFPMNPPETSQQVKVLAPTTPMSNIAPIATLSLQPLIVSGSRNKARHSAPQNLSQAVGDSLRPLRSFTTLLKGFMKTARNVTQTQTVTPRALDQSDPYISLCGRSSNSMCLAIPSEYGSAPSSKLGTL